MFSVEHLNRLRLAELDVIRRFLPPRARILEVGAGTGRQGIALRNLGYDVAMIDVESSSYAAERLCEITVYNGRDIPFADSEFDAVFSSNVLEHVQQLDYLHSEIRRVLKGDGCAIHVVPTHYWRLWSTLSAYPGALQQILAMRRDFLPRRMSGAEARKVLRTFARAIPAFLAGAVVQRRHGERGNFISELRLFHPSWWRKNFAANGFLVKHEQPVGLFYTGSMVMGDRLGINQRKTLAFALGSACELFVVIPAPRPIHQTLGAVDNAPAKL